MAIRVEPCEWPINTSCCRAAWDGAEEEQREFASRVATELLWRLSGRRFGLCEITVRPCRRACGQAAMPGWPPAPGTAWWPMFTGDHWINAACGKCVTGCACEDLCEVELPGPVHDVERVQLGAVTLPASGYRVDDHRRLVRLPAAGGEDTDDDGGGCWPTCQDMTAAAGEDGAFAVTYRQGIPVPPGGQYAAGVYACELVKACTGGPCRLPRRVQSITREGVQLTFLDPMDFLDKGLTGVAEVDTWIAAVNPRHRPEQSRVYSPDVTPPRTVTWP